VTRKMRALFFGSSRFFPKPLLRPLSTYARLIPKQSPLRSASNINSGFKSRPRSNVSGCLGLALGGVTICALASSLKDDENTDLKKDLYFERYQSQSRQPKPSNGQLLSPFDSQSPWSALIAHYTIPVVAISAINLLVFAAWRFVPPEVMRANFTLSAANLLTKRFSAAHTLITSMFSHQSLFHLAFNTLALTSVGPVLVQSMGQKDFLLVYFGCGLAAAGASIVGSSVRAAISKSFTPLVIASHGASGSVFGLFAIFANLLPDARFHIIFFPFFDFSADTMIKGAVAFDTLGFVYSCVRHSTLDHAAHLGGVFSGILAYQYLLQSNPRFRLRAERGRNRGPYNR